MINKLEPLNKNIEVLMNYNKDRVEVDCPMCHNTDWEHLDHLRPPLVDSHLCICKNCGFISYNPQMKNLQQWYSQEARPQDMGFLQTKATKLEKHRKILFEYLETTLTKLNTVLDYGSSDSYLIKALYDGGFAEKVRGIELNPGHANWAKYVYGMDVTTNADLKEYTDKSQDLIICYHVLEHIQKPDEMIAEFKRMLSDDGILYIGLPTLNRIDYPNRMQLFKEEHINWWTNETLEYFFNQNGFEAIHVNKNLYGTAMIFKKTTKSFPEKNFYNENRILLSRIHDCFTYREKADQAMSQGAIDQARVLQLDALRACNDYPELIIKYASINDPIDEQDILLGYIEKKPDFYELYIGLGLSYFKDSDLENAEKQFLKSIEIGGLNGMSLINLGQIKYYQKDFLKAVEYFKKLHEMEPYNQAAFEMLATILTKM